MKTIKQIADEIGVSKTAVRKKMTEEVKTKFSQTVSGKIYISETGENIIKSGFNKKLSQTKNQKSMDSLSETFSGEVSSNNILYEVLKEELKSKNIQIEKLQSELERERKYSREQSNKIAVLADQAQRLHLAEMSQIEKPLEEIEKEEVEVIKENPSFWKRVFGKKE